MANAALAQSISRSAVAAALRLARTACANDDRWLAALNRAALNLEACAWAWDGEILVIHSATADKRYTVDTSGCGCQASAHGHPCWHRAAYRLLVRAAEIGDLAEEIATAERVPMTAALRIAAGEISQLQTYARQWDAQRLAA